MKCKVYIQLLYIDPTTSKLIPKKILIKDNVDESVINFEDVADYVATLDYETRTALASELMGAKMSLLTTALTKPVVPVKDSETNQYVYFVSNTDLGALTVLYPELKNLYPDVQVSVQDLYTIVQCAKMSINGRLYYGRTLDSNGREVFFIKNFWGANLLFNYIDTKNKIKKFLINFKKSPDIVDKELLEDVQQICKHFNKNMEEILIDYLNKKSRYREYQEDGKIIIPQKILNSIISKIKNQYDSNTGKSDIEIILNSIKSLKSQPYTMILNTSKLYDVLKLYTNIEEVYSKNTFSSLDKSALETYLKNTFKGDARLRKLAVNDYTGDNNTLEQRNKKVTQQMIDLWYRDIKKEYKAEHSEKDTKDSLSGKLKDELTKENNLEHIEYIKTRLEAKAKDWLSSLEGATFTNIVYKDGKVTINYKMEADSNRKIVLSFPWSTIGNLYDFCYDSEYLFLPVPKQEHDELDRDGEYHGGYIYEYLDKDTETTHYAVSRHIISPNSFMNTFNSFEDAKSLIDHWNQTQVISDWGLWSIKWLKSTPRTAHLELGNLTEGLIITSLDLPLPRINLKNLPNLFGDLINGTVPELQKEFSNLVNINKIDTPEKAAAFIIKTYEFLHTLEKNLDDKTDIKNLIKSNSIDIDKIIMEIDESTTLPRKNYFLESISLSHTEATLKELTDNGINLSVSGKFISNDGSVKSAYTPVSANLENAINYFNDALGVNILALNNDELQQLSDKNKLDLDVMLVKAFVWDGKIYINTSNAKLNDLFHELAHIIMGIFKVKSPEKYEQFLLNFKGDKRFLGYLNSVQLRYANFALRDLYEETVADIIANTLFTNRTLSKEFKGEEITKELYDIIDKFWSWIGEVPRTGLAFNLRILSLLQDKTITSEMNRNMKITQWIKEKINNQEIKQTNC